MSVNIVLSVDGACRRNGQRGARGAIAVVEKLQRGRCNVWTDGLPNGLTDPVPTNQRAELSAIIFALQIAHDKCSQYAGNLGINVTIKSDSRYAIDCMNAWLVQWENNNWICSTGRPVTNLDLHQDLLDLDRELEGSRCTVRYEWIPREQNSLADRACNDYLDDRM